MTIETAIDRLRQRFGQRLTTSEAEREAHGQSESHFPVTLPDAVVYPESTAEVAELVEICAAEDCPLIGWGAGTSLEGHGLAVRGGVTVDFSRMAQVLELRPEDMVVRVQPGITRERLNEELRATGLFFPVDPGANASIGGMAMTRASGTTAVRYGTMRDNVAALELVTAAGDVIRTGTAARKSSAGYDLTALFVGSEGTLGLVTELTLRLHGQPEAVSTAVCAFPSTGAAVEAVVEAVQSGLPMARIELVDAATAEAVNAYSNADFPALPHLFVEFHGAPNAVAEEAARFEEIARDNGAETIRKATEAEERSRLWHMRHSAYWAILASRPGSRAIVTDVCVPISRLAEAIAATQEDLAAEGLAGPILGHVGDGNFHAILLLDGSEAERAAAERVNARMVERAQQMGGTATGEHGIGMGKLKHMQAEHGAGWAMMGAIKRALDPRDLFNPGKVVPQEG
ncbi:FAD-binding oxidoreductase [Histidinibacterium aquaticum]|uniref:D-lactate dehydrogenase (cytochrome) n=1 Tax=Histidinibacterium aquaticum TaxID=2613962 RepID=A0A5J5GI46_9RHOB|nr:FAD-linked oxidase C-terminal domain-containing protein [Histidinibacterium aquaticum]KAA9007919.1 FAD-binding protein [Histidinibacterium aquaticum]